DKSLEKEGLKEPPTSINEERRSQMILVLIQNHGRWLTASFAVCAVIVLSVLVNTDHLRRIYAISLTLMSLAIVETPIGHRLLAAKGQVFSQQKPEALLAQYENYLSVRLLHMAGRLFLWLVVGFLFWTNMALPAIQSILVK